MQAAAWAWGKVGLYGGFGGRLKEFEGDPEFVFNGDQEIWMILDLGAAPESSVEVLVNCMRTYAEMFDVPLASLEVGGELGEYPGELDSV